MNSVGSNGESSSNVAANIEAAIDEKKPVLGESESATYGRVPGKVGDVSAERSQARGVEDSP
jgi:hypothetical protein